MTVLTTGEKFEFLSIESCPRSIKSCSGPSNSPAISRKPGALKGTNLRSCLSCHSCSEERVFRSRVLDLYRLSKGIFAFALY